MIKHTADSVIDQIRTQDVLSEHVSRLSPKTRKEETENECEWNELC